MIHVHTRTVGDVIVATPVGRLDLSTHVGLRTALVKVAADNPAALIVDVDRLAIQDAVLVTMFAVLAGTIGDWPGIPLLLVARAPAQQGMLATAPLRRVASIHDNLTAALRACSTLPPYRYRRIHLPASALSVLRARLFVTDVVLSWNLADELDDLNSIVTELSGNAVQHARTEMWIRLSERTGKLRLSVQDQCPTLPARPGGGLRTVERLSTQWGATPTANGGKVVWAMLDRLG